MDKHVRIVPKRREPFDLERLAEALLDLVFEMDAAERPPAQTHTPQSGVSRPKTGRAA